MRTFSVKRNALMINVENIIQKNEKHDENFKNQNIMWKKKDITDILIYKIQRRQRCVFNHDAQTSR